MSGNQDFVIENGVLQKYNGPGGDVTIPAGVTKIWDNTFKDCTGLTSVTIPESVTEIGYNVFTNCRRLVIHAPAGSYAEQYAKKNSVKFEML